MPDPFVTTADLTLKLGQDTDTAKGTLCIEMACDTIRFITGQDIAYVEGGTAILDGTGTDALPLPQRPVLNAGTVVEGGETLVEGEDYKLGANGVLFRLPGVIDNGWGDAELRTYWWPGRQNIVVTYSHGHSTIPGEVKQVALGLAERLFLRDSSGIVFEQLGQRSVRYENASSELTGTEKLVLENIKR